jgi:hypothetical protein
MLPKDYIGKLVEVRDDIAFVDEGKFHMVGIIVAHEGPRIESVKNAKRIWGEDHFENYNHLFKIMLTTGETLKLFSDEFHLVGDKNGKI